MGKWSTYRRRGSVAVPAAAPPPPVEVLLWEQSPSPGGTFSVTSTFPDYLAAPARVVPVGETWELTRLELWVNRVAASSGSVGPAVWQAAGGVPTSTLLGTGAQIAWADLPAAAGWFSFPISLTMLTGTNFMAGLRGVSNPPGGTLSWHYGSTGSIYRSNDGGATWTPSAVGIFLIRGYGYVNP